MQIRWCWGLAIALGGCGLFNAPQSTAGQPSPALNKFFETVEVNRAAGLERLQATGDLNVLTEYLTHELTHYAGEDHPDDVAASATVATTEAQMGLWLGRDLADIDMAVLMIDGVHIEDHVLLVALGIDGDGKKHVLGIREGATENTAACTALLTDLRERNLHTDRTTLIVLDGAKALAKAVRELFGVRGLIQRCQCHKMRNVLDQLPEEMRTSVRQALREAYGCGNASRAEKLLTNLARRLRDDHPGAAASLEEGLDETLTVMRLGLPRSLERVLSTTNAIENLIGSVRDLGRRVKRWRNARMIVRWTVTALVDAASRFRRMAGARAAMSQLVLALRARDAGPVESKTMSA